MRFDKPESIIPGKSESGLALTTGGDDWLSRINGVINNGRELLKMLNQFREVNPMADANPNGYERPPSTKSTPLAPFLAFLVARGYDNIPIGELLERIKPLTIKQLIQLAQKEIPGAKS